MGGTENQTDGSQGAPVDAKPDDHRKYLVVVDETPECRVALRYASKRALKSGGHVSLLFVLPPGEFQHWASVEKLMKEEAREEAEHILTSMAAEVENIAGIKPELVIREGKVKEELQDLIESDTEIHVLVLGAATGPEGPGPLVASLGETWSGIQVAITIVPGSLSNEALDEIA